MTDENKLVAHKKKNVEEKELQERIIPVDELETKKKDGWEKVELGKFDVKKHSQAFQRELNAGRMILIHRTFVRKYQI